MLNVMYVFHRYLKHSFLFFFKYIWKNICDEILIKNNQEYATTKLITQLMYAFRDMQVCLRTKKNDIL